MALNDVVRMSNQKITSGSARNIPTYRPLELPMESDTASWPAYWSPRRVNLAHVNAVACTMLYLSTRFRHCNGTCCCVVSIMLKPKKSQPCSRQLCCLPNAVFAHTCQRLTHRTFPIFVREARGEVLMANMASFSVVWYSGQVATESGMKYFLL